MYSMARGKHLVSWCPHSNSIAVPATYLAVAAPTAVSAPLCTVQEIPPLFPQSLLSGLYSVRLLCLEFAPLLSAILLSALLSAHCALLSSLCPLLRAPLRCALCSLLPAASAFAVALRDWLSALCSFACSVLFCSDLVWSDLVWSDLVCFFCFFSRRRRVEEADHLLGGRRGGDLHSRRVCNQLQGVAVCICVFVCP